MLRALVFLALIVSCGSKSSPTTSSTSSTSPSTEPAATEPAATEPLPPVTAIGDRCRVAKDCRPLGPHHRCMRSGGEGRCYESPIKICDEPGCTCFNNDPCAANELGTCTGSENGVVLCSK